MWAQSFLGLFVGPDGYRRYSSIDGTDADGIDQALVDVNEWAAAEEGLQGITVRRVAAFLPLGLLVIAYSLLGAALWVWSAATLVREHGRPCDQPLKGWLYVTVMMVAVDKVYCSYRYSVSFDVVGNLDHNVIPALCSACMRFPVMVSGIWWYSRSETCAALSPGVHACVRWYLAFLAVFVVTKAAIGYALVRLVLRAARSGRFPLVLRRARRAARAGLVDELATVECAGDLLVEEGSIGAGARNVPSVCCICLGGFDSGGDIKRTPCSPVPHHFHKECLKTWLEKHGRTCPVCRADLESAVDRLSSGADLEKAAGGTPSGGDREEMPVTERPSA